MCRRNAEQQSMQWRTISDEYVNGERHLLESRRGQGGRMMPAAPVLSYIGEPTLVGGCQVLDG